MTDCIEFAGIFKKAIENAHTKTIQAFAGILSIMIIGALPFHAQKSGRTAADKLSDSIKIVEDEGKGITLEILQRSQSIGWMNIQSRVNFLKGKLDVQSTENKGVSVYLELTLSDGNKSFYRR